jgi:hypothetical protein
MLLAFMLLHIKLSAWLTIKEECMGKEGSEKTTKISVRMNNPWTFKS